MLNFLVHTEVPWFNLTARAVLVYLVVLILLRISGKRQLGQMGATEFVTILLISNGVQNAMNGGDNSLAGGFVLATVLVVLSSVISVLTYRSTFFSSFFEGTPTLLIHKGKVIRKHLMKERLSQKELKVLLRKQGIHDIGHVETAVLEADGTLSISKVNEAPLPMHEEIP